MIIKCLKMHNFGIYASDNVFELNNEKPVVLIGGKNGRGKTTFLEAVLLALYGSNSFAFQESRYRSYGEYLKSKTNSFDGTNESYVELEFVVDEDGKENKYIVNRSWNTNVKGVKDKVVVFKNGEIDEFLTNNWTMFIESILPSALSSFYFFDGEKIAELAESETDDQMKNSIKALLGINVIDLLEKDLSRIIKRLGNEKQEQYDYDLEELRNKKEETERVLNQIDSEIAALQEKQNDIAKKLEKKQEQFNAKGGNIASQSQALYSERISLNAKIEQLNEGFLNRAASELPLSMVFDLLSSIQIKTAEEKEQRSMNNAVNKADELFEMYRCQHKSISSEIPSFIEFMKANIKETENVFDLSDAAYSQSLFLINSQIKQAQDSYVDELQAFKSAQNRIAEIDNYLSVDIDEKAIQKIYKQITELKNKSIEIEVLIEAKRKQRVTANGEYIAATTEFNRCVEKVISTMERSDDVERLIKYALLAQAKSSEFRLALQESKIQRLAETMTQCYKQLLGKKNLIDCIKMDADTLDYHYIDKKGNEIRKSSLSAGEKQLMVVSMLWALAICSNKMLPVIIDTPLARLDKAHRKALLERYFPYASAQTIILSTDSEIDSESYNVVKPFVSNEFILKYNDDERRSYVKQGYFKEI